MAMGYGSVLAQGLLGGVMGAAQAAGRNALEEQKAAMEAAKEERLSKLRMQEHAANRAADAKIAEDTKKREEAETAAFYKRTGPQTKASTYTDQIGSAEEESAAGQVTSSTKETRRQTAERRLEEARLTGKKGLIDQAYGENKDIRSEDEQERKSKADEKRNEVAAIRAEADRMRAEASQEQAAASTKRAEALLHKMANPKADPNEKDTARIKDIKFYAENVFGGREAKTDEEKNKALRDAAIFVASKEDKSSADREVQIMKDLKDDPEWGGKSVEERMKKARELAQGREASNIHSRGGVKTNSTPSGNAAPKSAAPSTPKNKAEFDALPSGALWVNPKDGKTYRKP